MQKVKITKQSQYSQNMQLSNNKEKTVFHGQKYPVFYEDMCCAKAHLIFQGPLQLGPNIPQDCSILSALILCLLSTPLIIN